MATCGLLPRVIRTPNDDEITATTADQVILGGQGNDAIDGRGADLLAGQGGDDTITARDGTVDVVDCGPASMRHRRPLRPRQPQLRGPRAVERARGGTCSAVVALV
jgi:hypothetical protein